MNKILLTLIINFSTSLIAAETSVFTSLSFPSEEFSYVGVKKISSGKESESALLEIHTHKMLAKKIKLPNDLAKREIVSLIPASDKRLLIVTQYTMERGDNPKIHLYSPLKKTWSSLGEVSCIGFAKIKLTLEKIIFMCEETDDKGITKIVEKDLKLPAKIVLEEMTLELPIVKLEKGKLKGILEGPLQEWTKLKLTYKNTTKDFLP
jgi:hypothetical protein